MTLNVSLQGFKAGEERLNVVAHNLANLSTDDFKPNRLHQLEIFPAGVKTFQEKPQNSPELNIAEFNSSGDTIQLSRTQVGEEVVNSIIAQRSAEANASAARSQDEMLGIALDLKA